VNVSLSRRRKISIVSVTILGISTVFVSGAVGSTAFAKPPPAPTVNKLKATPTSVTKAGELVVISAKVTNADECVFYASHINPFPGNEVSCTTGKVFDIFAMPENKSSKPRSYSFTLSVTGYDSKSVSSEPVDVTVGAGDGGTVPLGGVASGAIATPAGPGSTECVVRVSSDVDCWGTGDSGELGDGLFITSDAPVDVKGVNGSGSLSGITKVVGNEVNGDFCALLSSSPVDCWGAGYMGELGDGLLVDSDAPVAVEGVNGVGVLTGVANLLGDDNGFCALLNSGSVDCWGAGASDQLGDGRSSNSATPVQVEGVNGSGLLTGVTELSSVGDGNESGYCALLTSTGVDCWGTGLTGQLGNGSFGGGSTVPVEVEGVNGSGTLTGVTELSSTGGGSGNYCAVLTTGGVDCWGDGSDGDLGNGTFYNSSPYGSAIPVAVVDLSGSGTLTGVANLSSDGAGDCALLTSDGVDCWGYGPNGQLGDGTFYQSGNEGSATPVAVEGAIGAGTLTGVANVFGMGSGSGYCAVLTSSDLDCWGEGSSGELGDGAFYQTGNKGIATPVSVVKATDLKK
jgi:alpha-tubulin suppressor-like RCC1 family protein